MFKIGCVNIDTSHPGSFAQKMKDAKLGMRYFSIFNDGFRTNEEVERFMETMGVEKRFDSLDKMAREVDIAFIHDCNWDKHIPHAMPFIKAGKPVFLDKPIVGNLRDCYKLEKLVKEGAVILGGSSYRYSNEIAEFQNVIKKNNENPVTIFGTCGVDEFNYGIHITEFIHGLLGPGAYSTTYLGVSCSGDKLAEQYLVKWGNGVQVIYQTQTGQWQQSHIVLTTDKSIHHQVVDTKKIYIPLLKKIEKFLNEGEIPSPINDLTETVKIHLAGKKSRETRGLEIPLQSLSLSDAGFDGWSFEKAYSMACIK